MAVKVPDQTVCLFHSASSATLDQMSAPTLSAKAIATGTKIVVSCNKVLSTGSRPAPRDLSQYTRLTRRAAHNKPNAMSSVQ